MARVIPAASLITSEAAMAHRPFLATTDEAGKKYEFTLDETQVYRMKQGKVSVVILSHLEARALAEQVMPNLHEEGTYEDKIHHAKQYLSTGRPIDIGSVNIMEAKDRRYQHVDGKAETIPQTQVGFGDGRHRTRALIDAGVKEIPIVVEHQFSHLATDYYEVPTRSLSLFTRISEALRSRNGAPKPKHFAQRVPWTQASRNDGPERLSQWVGKLVSQEGP